MKTRRVSRGGKLAWLAALASLLVGCAEDESPGAENEPEPNAAEPETPAEPEADPEPQPEPEAQEPEAAEPETSPGEPEPSGAGPDAATPEPDVNSVDGGPALTTLEGVCGRRGEGTVDRDGFEGFEERYIIGDEGFGDDVCVVRFAIERVGNPPPGCFDLNGDPCAWAHEVELGAGDVLTDDGGACGSSDLALTEAAIADIEGTRVSYGFVEEYVGHNSVLLVYDEASGSWLPNGNANWDDPSGSFRFDRRDGICEYQGLP